MADGNAYQEVSLQPNWRQLLIDEGLSILGALALLVAGGLDGVPAHTLLLCIGLALVAKVCYRLLYLRRMEYTITGEQLNFLQLLLGLKTVVVHSGDRTMPKLRIIGIREDAQVVECLRERVSYNRKRMNIHEFANYR